MIEKKNSFTKDERLLSSREFGLCLKQGRRWNTACFSVFLRSNGLPRTRLGLIVSKQVGNAVQRNQWKRKIRECFRLKKHSWGEACDIVVLVRAKQSETPALHLIESQLDRAVQKLTES